MNNMQIAQRRSLAGLVLSTLALVSCGGGGGGGGGTPADTLFVSIDPPGSDTVTTALVDLYGQASCGDDCPPPVTEFGSCPAINPPQSSSISITWNNRTAGTSGPAPSAIVGRCSCLFSQCTVYYSHRWSASVPLDIGSNAIEVRASGAGGASGRDSVTFTRLPAAVTGLTAVPGNDQVTLTWNPVGNATSYNLYVANVPDFSIDAALKIAGVSSPFTHAGLTADATFYYRVTAVAGGYESPASAVAWATPGWRTEGIDTTRATTEARDAAIAVDSAGVVHIHHSFDEHIGTAALQYNTYLTDGDGNWVTAPVANPLWVGASIAVDAVDAVRVAYLAFAGLTVASRVGSSWVTQLVDPGGTCTAALAVDREGHAHVAYFGADGGGTWRYATDAAGAWAVTDLHPTGDMGCYGPNGVAVGVDSTGAAHIAWAGRSPGYGLGYATNRGGFWSQAMLAADYVAGLSLAVDAGDGVHIAYTNNAGELKYARDLAGEWSIAVIESGGAPNHPSLAVEAGGRAHVSYVWGAGGGELRYAIGSPDGWTILRLDVADGDYGGWAADTAIALDSQGSAHIAYYRDGSLRYATNR